MRVYKTVRNTGLAVALDCGEFNNIHPIDKTPVGHRLCLQALCEVYGQAAEVGGSAAGIPRFHGLPRKCCAPFRQL